MALDLSFVCTEVAGFYGSNGNVPVDPVIIVKMMLLLFLDVRSLGRRYRVEGKEVEILWRRDERMAVKAMRFRLMAYTRGMPGGPHLRNRLARVESLAQLEDLAAGDLSIEASHFELAARG